ncbi:hypothetical protein BDF19DRAFT_263148 [Syncephalis fuscata]|nr:hypothetical protein BDF19DRAFT_263148 [Syncephalis fuscata]
MYSVVLRLQLCCLLALIIVSPVFATITLYDELRNKTLPLPSINFFQKELASYNHTSAWAIPAWKRNCTITEYVNKNDQDAVPHVRNTIVVPDLRSVWSMGCTSYFEVINAILASDEHLKKKDFPPIRGIIIPSPLPNEAAGGPEDAYCAGGVLLNSTQNAIPDIMKTGRASINNATYECEHPNFVNSGGEPVAVVIISQNTSQRIEKWFNDAINEFGEFDPRVKIEPEEGPWNEAFQTAGHKATQCTIVVMLFFTFIWLLHNIQIDKIANSIWSNSDIYRFTYYG